jgi:hypothetical protein
VRWAPAEHDPQVEGVEMASDQVPEGHVELLPLLDPKPLLELVPDEEPVSQAEDSVAHVAPSGQQTG